MTDTPASTEASVQHGLGKGWPHVAGKCPACGLRSLFVGAGGHVTCSLIGCPDPGAVDDLLHPKPAPDPAPRVLVDEADLTAVLEAVQGALVIAVMDEPLMLPVLPVSAQTVIDTLAADGYSVVPTEADLRVVPLRDRLTEDEREHVRVVLRWARAIAKQERVFYPHEVEVVERWLDPATSPGGEQ